MAHGQDSCGKKKAPEARFFCENTAPQAKLIRENALQARFFATESYWVLCPLDVVCKSLFTNHRSESCFFN